MILLKPVFCSATDNALLHERLKCSLVEPDGWWLYTVEPVPTSQQSSKPMILLHCNREVGGITRLGSWVAEIPA